MTDNSYQGKVYKAQGGTELVLPDGTSLRIEDGAKVYKDGVDITSSLGGGGGAGIDPLTLSPLMAYDLSDADSITLGTGTAIAQVNDLSGNGCHLTQATSGNRPTYDAASKAAVFNGASQWFDITDGPSPGMGEPMTALMVIDPDYVASTYHNFITGYWYGDNDYPFYEFITIQHSNGDEFVKVNLNSTSQSAKTITFEVFKEPICVGFRLQTGMQVFESNVGGTRERSPATLNESGTFTFGPLNRLGASSGIEVYYYTGKIKYLALFNTLVTSKQLNEMMKFLGNKFDLYAG